MLIFPFKKRMARATCGGGRMKGFIFGFITALLVGGWIILAIVGIISVKVAILVPVGILLGFIIAVLIFTFLFRT